MALKLRRQAEVFTNESLAHRISTCPPDGLGTGAGSFKRVLGSTAKSFFEVKVDGHLGKYAHRAPSYPTGGELTAQHRGPGSY